MIITRSRLHCDVYKALERQLLVSKFGSVVVRMLDLRLSVEGSIPGHDTAWLFLRYVTVFAGELSWDITNTQVNSALHSFGVAKSSNSFGWGKGEKVTADGWQSGR